MSSSSFLNVSFILPSFFSFLLYFLLLLICFISFSSLSYSSRFSSFSFLCSIFFLELLMFLSELAVRGAWTSFLMNIFLIPYWGNIFIFIKKASEQFPLFICCFKGSVASFIFFLPPHAAQGILDPQPGIEPVPPALRVQSLNYWTIREVTKVTSLS